MEHLYSLHHFPKMDLKKGCPRLKSDFTKLLVSELPHLSFDILHKFSEIKTNSELTAINKKVEADRKLRMFLRDAKKVALFGTGM